MFKDFKPFIHILLRFSVLYIVLLIGYQWYLNQYEGEGLDYFSTCISHQVVDVQNSLNYPSEIYRNDAQATNWFYTDGKYTTRMVEGCNAISIMILFISFIFAFYKGYKTWIYGFVGLLLLYIINLLRIAGLNIVFKEFPEYGSTFHDYVFPLIIYGTVVILWLIWIQFFVIKKGDEENQ